MPCASRVPAWRGSRGEARLGLEARRPCTCLHHAAAWRRVDTITRVPVEVRSSSEIYRTSKSVGRRRVCETRGKWCLYSFALFCEDSKARYLLSHRSSARARRTRRRGEKLGLWAVAYSGCGARGASASRCLDFLIALVRPSGPPATRHWLPPRPTTYLQPTAVESKGALGSPTSTTQSRSIYLGSPALPEAHCTSSTASPKRRSSRLATPRRLAESRHQQ